MSMNADEITQGMQIKDITTGATFTVVRLPNSRKKSYGVTEDGGSGKEKFVYRNELPRFTKA